MTVGIPWTDIRTARVTIEYHVFQHRPLVVAMQKSPFPGMDPYLEEKWPEVHASLIVYAGNQLNRQLPEDLQANIEESVSPRLEGELHITRPDIHIDDGSEIPTAEANPDAVAVAEPMLVKRSPNPERHIEIVHENGRVITAIEFISPWNKIGERARDQYIRKQSGYLDGGINLVEVDLVRRGAYILAATLEERDKTGIPYFICVFRRTVTDQFEVYKAPMQEPLPNVAIPLRDEERDIVLQLQPLVDDCYRDGRYYRINYQADPVPPLEGALSEWVDRHLRDAKLRS